ncbi:MULTISPECIES: serine/threonine-protein kinase [Streptomycetaceae]|uniref:non-specific serine/threonine protein kinase n=1 Tax=Streptantibioticus cattleyicolor (strain ATCC 35852 / DSM 46488 / JCM 4925 / NBRC 14057 / NRRL 8057) TaxID=1003195 RepID=F8JUE7_STREN|nr:serine/threonine-protein kinase [Streptantibioticus cattleyicolor]AEW94359.1 serine/threonine protein kinase [Streptantibioticus cattleyicolor NRRL 8057 = DSM 46488]MYS59008.1 protein kinase [Streptomyces sp. SID5468]CCB74715.1 Serine/threonine-protein kinase pkaA [Streptantibioticus cattleyicolor NRRL 8057 = DSM 46488]
MRPVGSKYLLEEVLGRGATGTVWRARVRETVYPQGGGAGTASQAGEVVAIKVLKEELAGDADIVMRFLRERSVLLRLSHPNIVRTRDLVVEGELLALVMDLVDGPDLHRYVRENGPFSPAGAALLTAQIADALAASHADGVVHRDLKPANVLLAATPDGSQMHPMLTDFGIARLADSPGVTRTHEFVGTPAYVAPESAEGRPQTSAVDVYGAGILLYELATGRPPFRGESALEVLHQHLSADPRRPSTMPEPLWTVIERCLRKNPDERPSAVSLARALRVVAHGIGVHATPEAAETALGVAALLAPDPRPARVPGTGAAMAGPDADPTQVLPAGGQADPTQVLPGGSRGLSAGDPEAATSLLPPTAGADGAGPAGGTRVMPPMPPEQPGAQGPHPWESQLNAARQRNEQTELGYLDPAQDPLRHRPRRRPGPPAAGYGARPAPPPPQRYEPEPPRYQPSRRPEPEPAPRREPPPRREPAPRREPRPRSRMRIPGAGCLKGCLFTIVVLVVVAVLVWNFTPLPEWVAKGRSLWETASSLVSTAWHWVSTIGSAAHDLNQGN